MSAPRTPSPLLRLGGRVRRRFSRACSGEGGFTLIEVLASAVVVTVFMLGALGGIDAATHSSGANRVHIDAQSLAQQYSDQLRGLTTDELAGLNTTIANASTLLDGTQFSVNEQAAYVSNSSQTTLDCSHPTGDYIKTTVTVTWPNIGSRTPVVLQSFVTPPVGGGSAKGVLYASVTAGGGPVAGATVSASGPVAYTGTTDSNGCVFWSGVTPGSYTLTVSGLSGSYVDMSSGAVVSSTNPPTGTVTVNAGSSAGYAFNEQQGGTIAVGFQTNIGGTNYASGAIGVVAQNHSMISNYERVCTVNDSGTCPKVNTVDTNFPYTNWSTAPKYTSTLNLYPLYPFNASSNPSGNYAVWPGVCSANEPASYSGTDATATVTSGQTTSVTLTEPALVIQAYVPTTTGSGGHQTTTNVATVPAHVYLKDTGCNVRYAGFQTGTTPPAGSQGALANQSPEQATIPYLAGSNYTSTTQTGGILSYPGMPAGTYNVCVDYGGVYGEQPVTLGAANQTLTFNLSSLSPGTTASSTELGPGGNQC